MKIAKLFLLSMLLLVGVTSCNKGDDGEPTFTTYTATLGQLNNSGANGRATLLVNGNDLTVKINASGLVANQPHPQHIHGLDDGTKNGTCPPASADTDNDGIITVPEGAPFYGAILLPLEDFPMADASGEISFSKTFTLGENGVPSASALASLENRVIVLHGLNNDGSYVATIPVACGEIVKN